MRGTKQLCSLVNIPGLQNEKQSCWPGSQLEGGLHVTGAGKLPKGTPCFFPARKSLRAAMKYVRAWGRFELGGKQFFKIPLFGDIPHNTFREQVSRDAACISECSLGVIDSRARQIASLSARHTLLPSRGQTESPL